MSGGIGEVRLPRHRLMGLLALGAVLFLWCAVARAEGPRVPDFNYGGTQRGACGSGGANEYAGPPVDVPWEPSTLTPTRAFAIAPSPVSVGGRVTFSLPEASQVELTFHDLAGRVVMRLGRGLRMDRGPREVAFSVGALLPGVYFCRFVAHSARGRVVEVRKFAVVR